jgi:hypothetical protein
MHLRLYITALLLTKSLMVLSQSKSCLDTNVRIQEIRNLYQKTQKTKSSLSVFELFESSGKHKYQLVPNDAATYLGDDKNDIIYYAGPVLFKYKKDTISALSDERIFVFKDKNGHIKLISSISHDDPEGASDKTTEYYLTNNNELYFSFSKVINRDLWSEKQIEHYTENRYYYCKSTPIKCLGKNADYPVDGEMNINNIQNENIDLSKAGSNYNEFKKLIGIINIAKTE